MSNQAVFIDPSYEVFSNDRLFILDDKTLNRDEQLLPFAKLKKHLQQRGIPVHTADKLFNGSERRELNHYWSLGLPRDYESLKQDKGILLRGFIIMEPPLIAPKLYAMLPELTNCFDKVYLYNITGDGYSLKNVKRERLHKLHFPQPHDDVLEEYWNRKLRLNKLVAIAGSHNPGRYKPELYSERIKAIAALSDCKGIDLFGKGWEKWWRRHSLWLPYWVNRSSIMSNFKGSCDSKWETLSNYRFSLCFENMPMTGYITEKLFDCMYAGTVPIYWGAKDIDSLVPAGAFIDMRKFSSYEEMFDYARAVTDQQWDEMRQVGREFIRCSGSQDYVKSLLKIIDL